MQEPFEELVIDCEEQHQGAVMEELGKRRAELKNMVPGRQGPGAPGVHDPGARA
jgi:GTP-binding protein